MEQVKPAVLTICSLGHPCRRGKAGQKHYTVHIVLMENSSNEWKPQLNEEHRDYKWFPVAEVPLVADLHPVVKLLVAEHWHEVLNLSGHSY